MQRESELIIARATLSSKSRTTNARKSRKSEKQEYLVEVSSKTVVELGIEEGEKKRGARRRRRRVRHSFCGDGECASGWKTIETFAALLSLNECTVWSLPVLTSDRHALSHV
eukprot:6180630-Pleurochrysis_carterae.AAC.1